MICAKTKMERGWVNKGGVMNSKFFGWGVAPLRLHFDLFLTVFRLGAFTVQ